MGTPDLPNVQLIAERDDWRIWSIDEDNADDVGDIGVISVEPGKNFSVKLLRPDGTPGARNVEAITLDPNNTAKHTSLTAATITGEVDDDIFVQPDTSDIGGVLDNLNIETVRGNITGKVIQDVTIAAVTGTVAAEELTGTLTIEQLDGALVLERTSGSIVVGDLSGTIEIGEDVPAGPDAITVTGDVLPGASITVHGELNGDLSIEGTFSGSLCALHLDANGGLNPLPLNIHIPPANIAEGSTVCGYGHAPPCGYVLGSKPAVCRRTDSSPSYPATAAC